MPNRMLNRMPNRLTYISAILLALSFMASGPAAAHHVLGRPAYALNEDSNTPPALQVETWIGDFDVNYMVFPAFPRPHEPGRVNLYVTNSDTGIAFDGRVRFTIRDDSWAAWLGYGRPEETLGVQSPDDVVFRQGFLFAESGNYIITARFTANNEPYDIDFPLRVGAPPALGPLGAAIGIIFLVLAGVSIIQRRRVMTGKIRSTHERRD